MTEPLPAMFIFTGEEPRKQQRGLLICKSKNKTIVEYALKNMQQAMGISEYQITQHLPESLKSLRETLLPKLMSGEVRVQQTKET